ncbi:ricin-type beta-trefoil lectin domain protein [Actinokineospora sp. HUAS TT18]|uniref:ricin-type beta-trefoil lectin domain protein n=1 Tax=Actinokineospora sp. HUAS TT18 TaxID=3447451 RepID=UPI003F520FB0
MGPQRRREQRWTYTANTLRDSAGRCLEASSSTNGAPVVLSTCSGSANQTWTRSA